MPEMNNYTFKVDSGLPVCSRAPNQKTAEERIRRTWPRSKVEFVGMNLPSAQRNSPSHEPAKSRPVHSSLPKGGFKKAVEAVEERKNPEKSMEQLIGDTFSGEHA